MSRCKKGDLAMFIYSEAGNVGKVVQCVKFVPSQRFNVKGGILREMDGWVIDQAVPTHAGGVATLVPDSYLIPICPDPNAAKIDDEAPIAKRPLAQPTH